MSVLTPDLLVRACQKAGGYTNCPELNEKLYLLASGLGALDAAALAPYTDVRALYLTDNMLTSLDGVEVLHSLRALWAVRNSLYCIRSSVGGIGVSSLCFLETLDLSENQIEQVEKGALPASLTTLLLGKNRLRSAMTDLFPAIELCPNLVVLDISHNELHSEDNAEFFLRALPSVFGATMAILNAQGNDVTHTASAFRASGGYHKAMKDLFPNLKCLDDVKILERDD